MNIFDQFENLFLVTACDTNSNGENYPSLVDNTYYQANGLIWEKNTNKIWDLAQGVVMGAKKCKDIPNKQADMTNCTEQKYGPRTLSVCGDQEIIS